MKSMGKEDERGRLIRKHKKKYKKIEKGWGGGQVNITRLKHVEK
jgi:hypothetical protein